LARQATLTEVHAGDSVRRGVEVHPCVAKVPKKMTLRAASVFLLELWDPSSGQSDTKHGMRADRWGTWKQEHRLIEASTVAAGPMVDGLDGRRLGRFAVDRQKKGIDG